jgi:prophage antirepressor-like protein
MSKSLTLTTFHRHNRPLRTLLLESQVWFCARDMGRLMGWPLNERTTRKLDADQRRVMTLVDSCGEADELMVSESGVYAMLVHHHHAENRELRQWITNEVVPCVRDELEPPAACSPCLSFLQWPGISVSMLHWRSEPWIRLRDMPRVLAHSGDHQPFHSKPGQSWWQAARAKLGRV